MYQQGFLWPHHAGPSCEDLRRRFVPFLVQGMRIFQGGLFCQVFFVFCSKAAECQKLTSAVRAGEGGGVIMIKRK